MTDNASSYAHTQMATNNATFIAGKSLYAALFLDTANPSLAGTEFAMAGYARIAVTWTNSGVVLTNTAALTWSTSIGSATWGGTALFDAASGGNRWFWADYSPRLSITASAPASIPIGKLELDFS